MGETTSPLVSYDRWMRHMEAVSDDNISQDFRGVETNVRGPTTEESPIYDQGLENFPLTSPG